MTPHQSENNKNLTDPGFKGSTFSDISKGLFYLAASISLIIVMLMFVLVWQPIWAKGFKDFHTITNAINELNKTAQPATETVPLMLNQMAEMNKSMNEMKLTMTEMHSSMQTLEEITPHLEKMDSSIENMTVVLSTQMGQMTYLIDKMESKFSPSGIMPYNW